ncbi:DUF6215 domain-containing protein [Streptomyces sp. NPDC127038]|uniref:DUF6215 domain-containing protein n=1 Tax=Streptomyces sp. NPDC127038 TaxID=3347114 RepID=UPI00364BE630
MLGLLLRLLPFWVREPLLIVAGSVLGVRLMYLAVRDDKLVTAGIGLAFLLFTAIRVHMVVRALRARRNPGPAAAANEAAGATGTAGAAVGAGAPPLPQPRPQPLKEPEKHNAWAQAFAAVGLFGVLAATLWLGPRFLPSDDVTKPRPETCSDETPEKLPKAYRQTPRPLTGEELCKALDRPDLAELLGTPGETATTVSSNNNTAPLTDGKVAEPDAEIAFDTYTVHASVTYNHLTTDQYVKLMKYGNERDIKTLKVLGRPAVLFSDHTMQINIDLGSGGTGGPVGQGPLARTLSVALDREDHGGSCDITVWSQTGALPGDNALLAIAEKVLPKVPAPAAR